MTQHSLFPVADAATLYQALIDRDPAYEGRAYVGVTTTGIFCRLTCPARKPKRENCRFFGSVAAASAAGFRPCKRCRPVGPEAAGDPIIGDLLPLLERDPTRRWTEDDIRRTGYDPSTVRRAFRRHFGMTFLQMARQRRLGIGLSGMSAGVRVTDAQFDAGFDSASGFRAAFARLLGMTPGKLKRGGLLQASWIETPLGAMVAVADQQHLHLLEFADRKALPTELQKLSNAVGGDLGLGRPPPIEQISAELSGYFSGKDATFDTPLALAGSAFTRSVWRALQTIPPGETRSYSGLAKALGRPRAVRAVARANAANQLAIIIPCHRVIGADGSLTGYGGGLWRKQKLIELEAVHAVRMGETR